MKKTLIQANDLEKVIDIFTFVYFRPKCTKIDVAEYCGFTLRQADYYLNACEYLDLLNKDLTPTFFAKSIFEENNAQVKECVYERIIIDEMFGKVFARILLFPSSDPMMYALSLVRDNYPEYKDSVAERRASIMVLWCNKILNESLLKR